ncbi:MAG: hypothetical protein HY306_00100 [Nitrosomonadales bacterium]|nr:hypothetical protein [Nitrosomonadales bacterium]
MMAYTNVDTAKLIRFTHLFAAGILAAILLTPYPARALGIGEIVPHSKLGEPLLAQVELRASANENVETSCLSLLAPDSNDEEARSYLLKASLELKTEGGRRYIVIRARAFLNELFVKLRLQVKCPGTGSVIKTLTILPDLESIPTSAVTPPVSENQEKAAPPAPEGDVHPAIIENQPHRAPARKHHVPPYHARANTSAVVKQGRQATFRLKLSGEPIDESRIGKISPEEREALLARQKLLDADDQMASFLALQHQVKQLQDELGDIKLKLAHLDNTAPASRPAPPANAAPAAALPPTETAQPDDLTLRYILAATGLAILASLLFLLRRRKAGHPHAPARRILKPVTEKAEESPAPTVTAPQSSMPASVRATTQTAATSKANGMSRETVPTHDVPEQISDDDAMLEEAGLYAVHGHPNRSIQILHEIIENNPAHTEARMLLISILSSLGRAEEFERAAREFHKHNENHESWEMVQSLGRTMDAHNPLYTGDDDLGGAALFLPQIALNKRRPVGDILVEMGALSMQDLKNCLHDFDPKAHGRFGGYLVSRKAITLTELNEALLQQQRENATEKRAGVLPTLQDMEDFMADYDPKRDGSIGEFLVARKAITPDQLNKVLQKAPEKTPVAPHAPSDEKYQPLEFDFSLEPVKETPASRAAAPFSAPFPEIDLNPEEHKGKK